MQKELFIYVWQSTLDGAQSFIYDTFCSDGRHLGGSGVADPGHLPAALNKETILHENKLPPGTNVTYFTGSAPMFREDGDIVLPKKWKRHIEVILDIEFAYLQ